jgi:hypothetical protein
LCPCFSNISWIDAWQTCQKKGLHLDNFLSGGLKKAMDHQVQQEVDEKGWHTFGHLYYVGFSSEVPMFISLGKI